MSTTQFKLPIGAQRQVTIPRKVMPDLALEEGHELLLELSKDGNHAILTPIVSIPRTDLPKPLREKFLARRGEKPTDIPLAEFQRVLRSRAPKASPRYPKAVLTKS